MTIVFDYPEDVDPKSLTWEEMQQYTRVVEDYRRPVEPCFYCGTDHRLGVCSFAEVE